MKFEIGQSASVEKTFSEEDVKLFSKLSLDTNPIHLDEEFARDSVFERRIVHGFLYASLISAVIANKLPGRGSVYLGQSLRFLKPVFIGDTVVARVKVKELVVDKNHLILTAQCFSSDELVVDGEARVKI